MVTHSEVVAAFGKLVSVNSDRFDDPDADPEFWEAVHFQFENGIFTVHAVPEDDTITTSAIAGTRHDRAKSVSDDMWSRIIGCDLTYIWVLTNQSGYDDGLQLEFRSQHPELGDTYIQIQLMIAASAVHVHRLEQLH